MRSAVSATFFQRLVEELQQRYRYVVVDVGADLLGSEVAAHRTALALSQQVLLAATPDLVGLWHARNALGLLRDQFRIEADRVALVLNRFNRRYQHGRAEIEWALGVPVAAVLPNDYAAAQRALMAQRPMVLQGRGRAARAFLDLAGRVHGGSINLPPDPEKKRRVPWPHWSITLRAPWSRAGQARAERGA
jgi:Flp pilus assembly CpaE family ATPase